MATDEQITNLLRDIDANQTTIDTNIKKKLLSLQNNNTIFTEALLKKIRNIMQLIQGLKPKFNENAEKLRQKQAELDKCKEAIKGYETEIENLHVQQANQLQDMSQKQLEIESLNGRIAELQQQIEELQGKIREFQATDADLEAQIEAEIKESEDKDAKSNAQIEAEIKESENEDEDFSKLLAENDAKLRQNIAQNPPPPSELYNQLDARKQELRNLEQERNNLSKELSRVQASNTKLMEALTKINQKLMQHIQIISQIVANIPSMAPYEEDLNAIEGELQALINSNLSGGKRRRKTKKMRGGYLYSRKSNSNSSSMNRLSGSNSKSKSRTKSRSKSRTKKNIF